jgi:hypothetical protein
MNEKSQKRSIILKDPKLKWIIQSISLAPFSPQLIPSDIDQLFKQIYWHWQEAIFCTKHGNLPLIIANKKCFILKKLPVMLKRKFY